MDTLKVVAAQKGLRNVHRRGIRFELRSQRVSVPMFTELMLSPTVSVHVMLLPTWTLITFRVSPPNVLAEHFGVR